QGRVKGIGTSRNQTGIDQGINQVQNRKSAHYTFRFGETDPLVSPKPSVQSPGTKLRVSAKPQSLLGETRRQKEAVRV
ncbi:hypothetical protein LINPERHAP1_LOCUS8818, partial [Linum perenne]